MPYEQGLLILTIYGSVTDPMSMTHLSRLEAESIHIMREVVAEAENPVMLYSVGKDSAVTVSYTHLRAHET